MEDARSLRKVITTLLTNAAFTRASSRPEVWAGDNGEIRPTNSSGNHHFLPCIIWGYLLRMPGRTWTEILARMLTVHILAINPHMLFPEAVATCPSLQEEVISMQILKLALSASHYLLSSQKNFSCQNLQISPWFITAWDFVFLLLFRSSSLPAQISVSHLLGLKFCEFLQKPSFLRATRLSQTSK